MKLTELRSKIDAVDEAMLGLFLERMGYSEKVAECKRKESLPLLNREREREILAKATARSGEMEKYTYHFFETLMGLSRARQIELAAAPGRIGAQVKAALAGGEEELFPQTGTVACQGLEGSYSQAACDRLLPRGQIVYLKTVEAVFDAVESGLCRFGVLPIENSTYGSVRANYDLLQRKNAAIVRSTRLYIRHELLAGPGTKLEDLTEIHSHEQALGQCSRYLASLPGVQLIPCANTALAAKKVAESKNPRAAAISSPSCAALYGLEVLAADILDSDNNYTRFICIAKEPVIYAGANKISLVVACDNRPGALYEILSRFSALGLNMSKLESCPVTGRNFEFIFFIELDASVKEPGILPMLEDLERSYENFVFLGNYAEV
ncbi:MAG: bifunctional chorismate mutase/prephenate dehydratase [Firmicutes bacterium]|nr:bifunctional chorismate mutase/prephenate dehydratase [Bacillota bacterium]